MNFINNHTMSDINVQLPIMKQLSFFYQSNHKSISYVIYSFLICFCSYIHWSHFWLKAYFRDKIGNV